MKKKEELIDFTIDDEAVNIPQLEYLSVQPMQEKQEVRRASVYRNPQEFVSCLSATKVTVRHVNLPGTITDKTHVLYGGMAESAFCIISVPRLRSGTFVNVLTNSEKLYLEAIMGLEEGALNVYNKKDNFWSNATEGGISNVQLTKQDTILHLDNPIDYIKYKILLANKELIAPNMYTLLERPKATYKYVLITEEEINDLSRSKMSIKKQCYIEYGKIESNAEVLRAIIEIITGKPLSKNTNIEFLQTRAGELIESDAKLFLSVIKDSTLATKILIRKANEYGLISKRGTYYYLAADNTPLCDDGLEPVLSTAAAYLNHPKRQELKLTLEAKVKD